MPEKLELEAYPELNLALAVFVTVGCRNTAKRRRETQSVGIISNYSIGDSTVCGGRVQGVAFLKNVG